MKVTAEVTGARRVANQRWTDASMVRLDLIAEADHDDRAFTADIPGHLERRFPVGRRVVITLRALKYPR